MRNVLDHGSFDVALELKQVNLLPVAAVQREYVPVFVDLDGDKGELWFVLVTQL